MSDDVVFLPVKNKRDDNVPFLVPATDKCKHYSGPFVVNSAAGKCFCKACGEEVSPMLVLERLMQQESRWMENRKKYMDEMERLAKRTKTKCRHCGQLTPISKS